MEAEMEWASPFGEGAEPSLWSIELGLGLVSAAGGSGPSGGNDPGLGPLWTRAGPGAGPGPGPGAWPDTALLPTSLS